MGHIQHFGRELTEGLLSWVFPPTCWICERPGALVGKSRLCGECLAKVTRDEHPCCPRCSSSVGPHVVLKGGCIRCRERTFYFDGAFRLGPYEGLLREVVLRLKSSSGEPLAEVMGEVWADALAARLASIGADVVIPVPLHWSRRWRRGFNQSEVLGRSLARKLGVPMRRAWLRRIRRTPPQQGVASSQRLPNVRGAFVARATANLVEGKTILLVDDVLTTGSTLSEAARALRPAKPKAIYVAVLAHGD